MSHTLEQLASQKSLLSIASNSDDTTMPKTHFKNLKSSTPQHWLCCRTINLCANNITYESLPIIFDLTTHIAHTDCFLTTAGDSTICNKKEIPIVSCWLKNCPDTVSQTEWQRMVEQLRDILRTAMTTLDTSELIQYNLYSKSSRLQVSWSKTDGRNVRPSLLE
jgi:hypothetical protein